MLSFSVKKSTFPLLSKLRNFSINSKLCKENDWDFFEIETNAGETKVNTEDSFDLNAIPDDLYATPTNLKIHESKPTSKKVEFIGTPVNGDEAKVKGIDSSVFKPRSKMGLNESTKRERMIFGEIFASILSKNSGTGKNTNTTKYSQKMQAFFDNEMEGAIKGSGVGVLKDDVRKMPLSMSSLFLHEKNPISKQPGKDVATEQEIADKYSKIIQHIETGFETDVELYNFYKDHILSAELIMTPLNELGEISLNDLKIHAKALPVLLNTTLKNLALSYQSPTLSFSLFSTSKSRSLEHYVTACTLPVYVTIMSLQWQYYRSLSTLENLISEIDINGLVNSNSKGLEELVALLQEVNQYTSEQKFRSSWTWSQEDEERVANIRSFRLKILEMKMDMSGSVSPNLLKSLIDFKSDNEQHTQI